ncbi:hypothetical protein ACFE04_022305 [Oxalis oulophora]
MASSKVMMAANRSPTNQDMPRTQTPLSSSSLLADHDTNNTNNHSSLLLLSSQNNNIINNHQTLTPSMSMDDLLKSIYPDPTTTTPNNNNALSPFVSTSVSRAAEDKSVDEVWTEIVTGGGSVVAAAAAGGGGGEGMTVGAYNPQLGGGVVASSMGGGVIVNGNHVVSTAANSCGDGRGILVVGGSQPVAGGRVGRGKRRAVEEPPVDKATLQKQRRMIKNRESAARSRNRKQALTNELETLVTQLEEENARLLQEEAEEQNKRYKQLMENIIPVVEKQKTPRTLRRVNSTQCNNNRINWSTKRLTSVNVNSPSPSPSSVTFDAVHDISVYIHRFHNLDLFQQGWYQIKITVRWEDSDFNHTTFGIPARVVQYQVPDKVGEDVNRIWMIDDTDNSFSTHPFRIRYARQDVFLSIMVSFNLHLNNFQVLPTSAIILKFELMYTPVLKNGSTNMQTSIDACSVASHEFRLPPKALLGSHSYCPVSFDSLHAVLVDTSVHVSLLKAFSYQLQQKVPRFVNNSCNGEDNSSENFDGSEQSDSVTDKAIGKVSSLDSKQVILVKTLVAARDTLLEDMQKISKAINEKVDLSSVASKLNDKVFFSFLQEKLGTLGGENSGQLSPTRADVMIDFSGDDPANVLHSLGNQIIYLWNMFLLFHRTNKTKIIDFLRDSWADDRRSEWSIWMVHSRVEMSHMSYNKTLPLASRGKALSIGRLSEDPAQSAALRAELHRRSIAQMRINNRSIQDMHMFEDPARIPVIIVERIMDGPTRTISGNSYYSHTDMIHTSSLPTGCFREIVKVAPKASSLENERVLKVVVFVHGFQGHHLDLRLVRNQWLLVDPKIEFLMSEINEEKTSGDFREMGLRLAEEVISFLKKKMDKVSRTGNLTNIKLSFVGHSIGNIILRSAIAETIMEPYLRYLNIYVSISGPHLGYLYSSNSLFNSGLWLLKKFKGTQCIHQLTFSDDPDIQNTFLYKLCMQKTLENFTNIILLSSPQDGYIPYHSARIEMCEASLMDYSKKGKAFMEMLNSLLGQIRANATTSENRVFMRCDVNFDTSSQGRNFNTIIGRAAHIEFLECENYIRFIMWSFPELFN